MKTPFERLVLKHEKVRDDRERKEGDAYVRPAGQRKGWWHRNWWWVVAGTVGAFIVMGMIDSTTEDTPLPPGEIHDTRAEEEKRADWLMDWMVDATFYLGLEYDINIDKTVLRTALEEREAAVSFPDIGEFEYIFMRIATWGDSPTEQSNKLKDVLLEEGNSPREYLENMQAAIEERKKSVATKSSTIAH